MNVQRKPEGLKREPLPEEWLVFGFLSIILLGALLLALPLSTRDGHSIGLFDGLFTAASAVCVTGLIVVDTGTTFTVFGKTVLGLLIQAGGDAKLLLCHAPEIAGAFDTVTDSHLKTS